MRARTNEVRLLLLGCLLKPVKSFVESEEALPRGSAAAFINFDVRRGLGRTPARVRNREPSQLHGAPFGD
jgi:hypothetical protein